MNKFSYVYCGMVRLIRSYLLMPTFRYCHRSVRFNTIGMLTGNRYISIGEDTGISRESFITVWPANSQDLNKLELKIGKHCTIGAYNHISVSNRVEIGDGFLSGKWVSIIDNSHGETDLKTLMIPPLERQFTSKGPIIIGKNVWVGDKATILANVKIGDGAVIASNAVVTKDVPPYCVVAGCPARVIKRN